MRKSGKAGRIDANQNEIVEVMRNFGATVNITSDVGGGFADLVVSYRNEWFIIEVKDGKKSKSAQQLTEDEIAFHVKQKAVVYVITTAQEAINLLTNAEAFRALEQMRWQTLKEDAARVALGLQARPKSKKGR